MDSLPARRRSSGLASGQWHAFLLLALLLTAVLARYLWSVYGPVPLSRLQFEEVVLTDLQGVVIADTGVGLLVVKNDMLLWHRGNDSRVLARQFVNLLEGDKLYINTGSEVMVLSPEGFQGSPVTIDEQLRGAVLVSVGEDDSLHFYHQGQVWIQDKGQVEAVAEFDGDTVLSWLAGDWQKHVLFFDHQSWTVYSHYQQHQHVEIAGSRGLLVQACLGPGATGVVFALEHAGVVSVWHSRADGSNMVQWLEEEMNYGALEVAWSEDGSQVMFTLIGSLQAEGEDPKFTSITAYARPGGERIVELDRRTDSTVMASVPTAWAADGKTVYIHRVFDEAPVPRAYLIQRR